MNKDIQKYLDESVKNDIFPGCACAILKNDSIDYYCSGYKSIYPKQEKNNIDTLYDLASLTKVVATTPAILKLIQDDLLSYETCVHDIIPQFRNREMTIFHLLTHTSGLPADLNWDIYDNRYKIIEDICQVSENVLPNGHVIYSDLGYILLGIIVEEISKMPLDQFVYRYVFKPLQMTNTHYCIDTQKRVYCAPTEICIYTHKLLRGEVHDRKARCFNGIAGHAGVFSNVFDLAHYVRMILNNGVYDDKVFLNEQYINDMFTCITPKSEVPRSVGFLTYSNDSIFSKYSSTKTIAHTGFTGTSLYIDRENQIGIILLSNRVHPTRENKLIIPWRKNFHDYIMKYYTNKNVNIIKQYNKKL